MFLNYTSTEVIKQMLVKTGCASENMKKYDLYE